MIFESKKTRRFKQNRITFFILFVLIIFVYSLLKALFDNTNYANRVVADLKLNQKSSTPSSYNSNLDVSNFQDPLQPNLKIYSENQKLQLVWNFYFIIFFFENVLSFIFSIKI